MICATATDRCARTGLTRDRCDASCRSRVRPVFDVKEHVAPVLGSPRLRSRDSRLLRVDVHAMSRLLASTPSPRPPSTDLANILASSATLRQAKAEERHDVKGIRALPPSCLICTRPHCWLRLHHFTGAIYAPPKVFVMRSLSLTGARCQDCPTRKLWNCIKCGIRPSAQVTLPHWLTILSSYLDKIPVMAPIQLPTNTVAILELIKRRPMLAAAIAYVTTSIVPGYRGLRERLAAPLSRWVDQKMDPPTESPNKTAKEDDEIATLQTCIILCNSSRCNAVRAGHDTWAGAATLKFFAVKATCESYARQVGLHKTGDALALKTRRGTIVERTDPTVQKYFCWLWMYCNSHQ